LFDLGLEELQGLIEDITGGQKLVTIEMDSGEPEYVIFKHPVKRINKLADIEYDKAFRMGKKLGLQTEEEMEATIRSRGIWTEQDDEKIEGFNNLLIKWRGKLKSPDLTSSAKSLASELIAKTEEDMYQLEKKREIAMVNTIERRARQAKYDYLVWACSYNPETDEKFYNNYLTYCEKVDAELKSKLLGEFLRYLIGHTTEEIRYIARSNLWRIQYVSAQKANMPLFPCSIYDLTPDQLNLIWWSSYYQSIYEMLPDDQPDDRTIEDDEALDKYMEDLHKERSKERASKRAEKKYGSSTAMKLNTALIMRSNPEYWDYEYDKVNPSMTQEDRSDLTLKDDPRNKGRIHKKTKGIQRSKRFNPNEK
jgi:hypothetical protein